MRDYGKISPQFWIGKTGKAIRKQGVEAQIVSFYLMTCPQANMLGLYYTSINQIGYETSLGIEGASKGLRGAIEAGFCQYDEESEVVWVMEMAHYQIAQSLDPKDNQCKGIQKEYNSLVESPFLPLFFDKYKDDFHLTQKRGATVEVEAPLKPLRSQEQEQEQEHDQEQEQNTPPKNDNQNQTMDDKGDSGNGALLPHVALSIEFRKHGIQTQPANPKLLALASQGVSVETVGAACLEAKASKPGEQISVNYVIAIIERWSAEAAKIKASGAVPNSRDSPARTSRHSGFEKLDYSEGIKDGRIA